MPSESLAQRRMTLDEFYQMEGEPDTRYELLDGVVLAMTPPSNAHGALVVTLAWLLKSALKSRPSCSLLSEVGIRSLTRSDTHYQADLAISCSPQSADSHEINEPLLIVEVLSPSTEDHDRKVKTVDYRKLPSLREVLLVDSRRPYCELHRRLEGDRWLAELVADLNGSVRLESIDAELPLAELYADLEVNEV